MTDATGTTAAEWTAWRSFRAAHARVSLEIDRRLAQRHGLEHGEYATLSLLRDAGGALRTGQVAEGLGWEQSRASHLLGRMERKGLVERERARDDARGILVTATAEGRRRALEAVRAHADDVRELFWARLTPDELQAIERACARLLARDEA